MKRDGGSYSSSSGSERMVLKSGYKKKKCLMNALDMKCEREIKDVPHILYMYLLPMQQELFVCMESFFFEMLKQPISLTVFNTVNKPFQDF